MAPTDEMMPTLPEPWEALLGAFSLWKHISLRDGTVAANHAAFEAERALRVALLDLLRGGNIDP